jgi:hypothetical protein
MVSNKTSTQPEWSVECRVVVACPPPQSYANAQPWRIAALELISGRTYGPGSGGPTRLKATTPSP